MRPFKTPVCTVCVHIWASEMYSSPKQNKNSTGDLQVAGDISQLNQSAAVAVESLGLFSYGEGCG
jgi:hypothetical protein